LLLAKEDSQSWFAKQPLQNTTLHKTTFTTNDENVHLDEVVVPALCDVFAPQMMHGAQPRVEDGQRIRGSRVFAQMNKKLGGNLRQRA
jgi:hypothetical protein